MIREISHWLMTVGNDDLMYINSYETSGLMIDLSINFNICISNMSNICACVNTHTGRGL